MSAEITYFECMVCEPGCPRAAAVQNFCGMRVTRALPGVPDRATDTAKAEGGLAAFARSSAPCAPDSGGAYSHCSAQDPPESRIHQRRARRPPPSHNPDE